MARRKVNKIDGQFNARLIEMMVSPAYRVLSLSARRVLDRICIELAHHGGNDNGKLPVTYDQFEEYGIHRHAIGPAIRELEALGFVEVTQRGKPSAGEHRLPNLFRLTCVNCKSTPNPTHEWRRVPDIETAEALACGARPSKNKTPVVETVLVPVVETALKTVNPQCGNHHYCPSAETTTTSISPVKVPEEAARDARPSKCAVASGRLLREVGVIDPQLDAALSRLAQAVR